MSETKTAGDVYNEAWDECAAGRGWGPVSAVDRPAWAKECDEAAAQAVIAWYEAQRPAWPAMRPMADAPRDGTPVLLAFQIIDQHIQVCRFNAIYRTWSHGGIVVAHEDDMPLGWWPLPEVPR